MRANQALRCVLVESEKRVVTTEAHEGVVHLDVGTQSALVLLHPHLAAKRVTVVAQLQPFGIEHEQVGVAPDHGGEAFIETLPEGAEARQIGSDHWLLAGLASQVLW